MDTEVKAQPVRVLDVFLIGPLMFWAGASLRKSHPVRGYGLAALGVATVIYNARNYLEVEKRR